MGLDRRTSVVCACGQTEHLQTDDRLLARLALGKRAETFTICHEFINQRSSHIEAGKGTDIPSIPQPSDVRPNWDVATAPRLGVSAVAVSSSREVNTALAAVATISLACGA